MHSHRKLYGGAQHIELLSTQDARCRREAKAERGTIVTLQTVRGYGDAVAAGCNGPRIARPSQMHSGSTVQWPSTAADPWDPALRGSIKHPSAFAPDRALDGDSRPHRAVFPFPLRGLFTERGLVIRAGKRTRRHLRPAESVIPSAPRLLPARSPPPPPPSSTPRKPSRCARLCHPWRMNS